MQWLISKGQLTYHFFQVECFPVAEQTVYQAWLSAKTELKLPWLTKQNLMDSILHSLCDNFMVIAQNKCF